MSSTCGGNGRSPSPTYLREWAYGYLLNKSQEYAALAQRERLQRAMLSNINIFEDQKHALFVTPYKMLPDTVRAVSGEEANPLLAQHPAQAKHVMSDGGLATRAHTFHGIPLRMLG